MEHLLLSPENSIREGMDCINRNRCGIVLLVDNQGHLLGTVTDGDIRRAILAGFALEDNLQTLLDRGAELHRSSEAVTAPASASNKELLALMRKHAVQQIPLLDPSGAVSNLVTMNQLLPAPLEPLRALIMAGGFGTRLRPLTNTIPKPMLPVGDYPLLEHIIKQLHEAGITQISISTHYLSDQIVEYFGSGEKFDVELSYINESEPLGTAGALGLIEKPTHPLLVMNGDILTKLDFRALLTYHREHEAVATVSVRKYDVSVPYGVVDSDGINVRALVEKPEISLFVNAGVYLLEPEAHDFLKKGERIDMTQLVERVLDAEKNVVAFPVWEQWLDIGKPTDYELAQTELDNK